MDSTSAISKIRLTLSPYPSGSLYTWCTIYRVGETRYCPPRVYRGNTDVALEALGDPATLVRAGLSTVRFV